MPLTFLPTETSNATTLNRTNAERVAGSFDAGVIVFETDTDRSYIKTSSGWVELTNVADFEVQYYMCRT